MVGVHYTPLDLQGFTTTASTIDCLEILDKEHKAKKDIAKILEKLKFPTSKGRVIRYLSEIYQ